MHTFGPGLAAARKGRARGRCRPGLAATCGTITNLAGNLHACTPCGCGRRRTRSAGPSRHLSTNVDPTGEVPAPDQAHNDAAPGGGDYSNGATESATVASQAAGRSRFVTRRGQEGYGLACRPRAVSSSPSTAGVCEKRGPRSVKKKLTGRRTARPVVRRRAPDGPRHLTR
jgi:hypothetical protein